MNDAAAKTSPAKSKRILQIAFTTDKNGRPIAYYLSKACLGSWRWIKMGIDAAKVAVATGEAVEIPYARNW